MIHKIRFILYKIFIEKLNRVALNITELKCYTAIIFSFNNFVFFNFGKNWCMKYLKIKKNCNIITYLVHHTTLFFINLFYLTHCCHRNTAISYRNLSHFHIYLFRIRLTLYNFAVGFTVNMRYND